MTRVASRTRYFGERSTPPVFGCLLSALMSIACGSDKVTADDTMPPSSGVVAPLDVQSLLEGNRALTCDAAAVEQRVDGLVATMTLEQKIAEMHGLQSATIDGLYYSGGDDALGIPVFKMVDGPRGVSAGAGAATAFPVGMARGATWDPELERRVGLAMGQEVAAKGGNVLLAPTINLLRHPGWGRAQETYSEDPFHMGRMAVAFIGGAQNTVLASAKHFAANSIENTRFSVSANLDERTLREVYLPHFRQAVEVAHVASVMSAYNRVNDTYCAENPHLLRDILKGDWGFEGFVESDWLLGVRSTVPSALAGLDIEMPSPVFYGSPLVDAVRAGEVPESVIDEAVKRILRQKFCFALDAPPAIDPSVVESDAHKDLALEVARKAIVLLKNEGAVLPISATTLTRVAVVGELATVANMGDHGSSNVAPSTAVAPLDGIVDRIGSDKVVAVATNTPTAADLQAIADADMAVVVAGLTYLNEGEFIPGTVPVGDRASLGLPADQEALIAQVAAHAKRTVVILEGGSAILVRSFVDDIDALLMAWYPGMQGGVALADILFGKVNPSGRLPVTFPRSEDQLPPWDITSDEVTYDYLHGYRLLDENKEQPEYAFGFGLSYSETSLGRVSITPSSATAGDVVTVSVDVHNRGDRDTNELVQVYGSAPASTVMHAPRVLVGFGRVMLAPGEVKTVRIAVPITEAFGYWDDDARAWTVESTKYVLEVGKSSRDVPMRGEVDVR